VVSHKYLEKVPVQMRSFLLSRGRWGWSYRPATQIPSELAGRPHNANRGLRASPGDIGCLMHYLLGLPIDRYSEYGAVPKAQRIWLRAGRPPPDGPMNMGF